MSLNLLKGPKTLVFAPTDRGRTARENPQGKVPKGMSQMKVSKRKSMLRESFQGIIPQRKSTRECRQDVISHG